MKDGEKICETIPIPQQEESTGRHSINSIPYMVTGLCHEDKEQLDRIESMLKQLLNKGE